MLARSPQSPVPRWQGGTSSTRGRGTACGRSEPLQGPTAASLRPGPLKVPGFAPSATCSMTGTSLSAWSCLCIQRALRSLWRGVQGLRGVGAQHGGSVLEGTGLPLLCVPAQGEQTPRGWGTPGAGLCQGPRLWWEWLEKVDSSNLNHAGQLLVRRHRLSHRCRTGLGTRTCPGWLS